VINPIAGDHAKDDLPEMISAFAERHQLAHALLWTTGKNDKAAIREKLETWDPEVVVAAGGDGTVNLVAHHLRNSERILGIIPLGSGNGIAKDLDIPQWLTGQSLELLKKGKIHTMDTLDVNGHFCLHITDIGFNARIVRLFNKDRSRGLWTYLKHTVREFFQYQYLRISVSSAERHFKARAFMAAAANSNRFGSNLTINPEGRFDDGVFEVIVIKRFPRKEALRLFFRLLFQRIQFSPYCIYFRTREVKIRLRRRTTLQVDGEDLGRVSSVHVKILPQSLRVLVPQSSGIFNVPF